MGKRTPVLEAEPLESAPLMRTPDPDEAPTPPRRRVEAPSAMAINVDKVEIATNIRHDLGELEELAASIREVGMLQPITVTAATDDEGNLIEPRRFRVLLGHRRLAAAKLAGYETVPAIFDHRMHLAKASPQRSIEQLVENLQRADLNPVDEARALRQVLDADRKLTQEALADKIGRSRPWVANTLALLRQPKPVQELVADGKLTAAHARAVNGLAADEQVRLAKSAATSGSSAHDLEESARWARERAAEQAKNAKLVPEAAERAIAALEKAKTPKDVPLIVNAGDWRIHDDDVRKLVAAAGYAVHHGYVAWGDRPKACDCPAIRVRVAEGKGTTIEPACISAAHAQAVEDERRAKMAEKASTEEREREELQAAIAKALTDRPPHPVIIRLLLRTLDSYAGDSWTEYAKKSDAAAIAALAARISTRHGTAYGKPVPVKTVLKELARIDAADEAHRLAALPPADGDVAAGKRRVAEARRLPRGKCSVCGADVALRKGGLVREHARYSDEQPGVMVETVCKGSGVPA